MRAEEFGISTAVATEGRAGVDADEAVIRALTLPAVLPGQARTRSRKLDVGDLQARLGNADLHFAFSFVDDRGRLRNQQIFTHLRWTSGLRLRGMLGQNYVLLRPDRSGDLAIDQRSRLLLPANLLHYCGIGEERQVLLVAAFEHEMLVVHPVCNMTDMVRTFHANQFERAVYGGVARGGH